VLCRCFPKPTMSEPSQLYADTTPFRKILGGVAFIFGAAAMVMTAYWAHGPNTDDGYLGGLNMKEQMFNWHPVLMVSGFIFCFISSLLTYRLLPVPKYAQKVVHALCHAAAIICTSIGLACVLTSGNDKDKNPYDSHSANFFTIHSFIGIGVFCVYGLNFLLGLFHFLLPGVDVSLKQQFLPTHVFLGTFLLFAAFAAVESGIMLQNTYNNCGYQPSSADTNPAQRYHLMSEGCRLGNSIGVVVVFAVFLTYYTIFRFGTEQAKGTDDRCGWYS
jgi:cytochrome b-561